MKLRFLASTKNTFHGTLTEAVLAETALHSELLDTQCATEYTFPPLQQPINTYARHNTATRLRWLNDGSSLLSVSEDNGLRVYIAPPTLREGDNEPLVPFTRSFHASPIIATDVHPHASPYAESCPILISSSDVPLKMIDLLPSGDDGRASVVALYNTQHAHAERYFKIHSLMFTTVTTFLAGMSQRVLLFDVSRPDPVHTLGSQGIVSCFGRAKGEFGPGGFYAGSFSNWVTMFGEDGTKAMEVRLETGNGVSQIMESDNGRFVYAVTRNSDVIEVLDVRMGLQTMAQLTGFESGSQRLYGDVLPQSQGLLIGTSSGLLNLYEDAEMGRDGCKSVVVNNQTAIPSVVVNPTDPNIIAYSMGDRDYNKPEVHIACIE